MKLTGLLLCEPAMLAYMVSEVTTREIIHYQVEIFPVLESIVHIDDIGVVELSEDLSLVHY